MTAPLVARQSSSTTEVVLADAPLKTVIRAAFGVARIWTTPVVAVLVIADTSTMRLVAEVTLMAVLLTVASAVLAAILRQTARTNGSIGTKDTNVVSARGRQ